MTKYLINTMGKTGSISIKTALESIGIPVEHEHNRTHPKNKPMNGDYMVFVPIREAVSRNISAYFENFYKGKRVTASDFIHEYKHAHGLIWVEREIGAYWGVDVYAEPFDVEKGWHIYKAKNASILIIRRENLDREWTSAYQEFTGNVAPPLGHDNVTLNKPGKANEYRRFLNQEVIPEYYINWVNSSPYMRHFYPDFIERNGNG